MRLFLLLIMTFAAWGALTPPANTGSSYFIANEGQWAGDFQFKCEVGSTTYYITPQGMTVDFRSGLPPNSSANLGGLRGASSVFVAGVPPAPDRFTNEQYSVILNAVKDPSDTPVSARGHVIQIHYASGLPPFTSATQPPTRSGLQAGFRSDSRLLAGGQEGASAFGANKLPHYSNYFLSRDSTKWRSRVGHFENLVVPEVWPGIDVEYRADKQGVETIYHIQPGADPAQIQMEYLGLDQPLQIDAHGNLILSTSLGDLKEQAPYSYQQQGRVQQKITSSVRLLGENRIGFNLGEYDRAKELVIDPLLYGTYLGGGAEDDCYAVTPAPEGGVYVSGSTEALSGFPTTPGAYDETGLYVGRRLFCSHFGPNGELIASTLLGEVQTSGNPNTEGVTSDLVYDSLRNAVWICGDATTDWPVTPDALDTIGDVLRDAIILRLNEGLTNLEYCSYLGAGGLDQASGIEIDSIGQIYVTGRTRSTEFPVTPDAFYSERRNVDCFLWVFDPTSYQVVFSTYFGGSDSDYLPNALHLADDGIWLAARTYSADIPVTENAFQQSLADTNEELGDAMIACITLNPPTVEYCTYLGGGGIDDPYSLAVDDSILFIAGQTSSQNFPVSVDAFDTTGPSHQAPDYNHGFISSVNWRTGEYRGTYIGGSAVDRIVKNNFQVHGESVTLLGITSSIDFPVANDAYQSNFRGELDGFVVKLTRDLRELLYGTYIGGTHIDQYNAAWIENKDSLWAVGFTLSIDFPTTPDALQPGDNGLTSGFVQHFAIDTTADTTDAAEHRPLPTEFAFSAFPNPFNPTTTLSFDLQHTADVKILIHDVLGRVVERLVLGTMNTGSHAIRIGNNDWASGIYFATISTQTFSQTAKLLLLK